MTPACLCLAIPCPALIPSRLCSAANAGFLGVRLSDLVVPGMQFCIVVNFMVDAPWLFSACPALRDCPLLIMAHGESGPR